MRYNINFTAIKRNFGGRRNANPNFILFKEYSILVRHIYFVLSREIVFNVTLYTN